MPSPRIRRLLPVAVVAAATALALTGCEPGVLAPSASPGASSDAPSATPEPSTSGPVETPEPTPAPTGSALPTTPPVAGEIACEDVLSAEQLYEFNPNFAPSSQQGSLPGAIGGIAEAGGTVCAFQHVTASDRLLVAVLQDAAGFSAPAFETAGGMGIATEPAGGSVVAVASEYFDGAPNAQPVLEDVAANIG